MPAKKVAKKVTKKISHIRKDKEFYYFLRLLFLFVLMLSFGGYLILKDAPSRSLAVTQAHEAKSFPSYDSLYWPKQDGVLKLELKYYSSLDKIGVDGTNGDRPNAFRQIGDKKIITKVAQSVNSFPTQGQEKASPGKDAQALVATFTYNNGSKQSVYFYNARLLAPNTAFYQGTLQPKEEELYNYLNSLFSL